MAILDGIEVLIASRTTGKALDEYDKPNTVPSKDALSVERFVKAETGLEFHVEVFVKPSFKFHRAWGIQIAINIDGGKVNYCKSYSKERMQKKHSKAEPIVFDNALCKEGTQYSRIKFNFGSLDIDEELDLEKEALDRQADALGSIRVSLRRVRRVKRSVLKPVASYDNLSSIIGVAKELVKDRSVSYTMKPGEKTSVETPEPNTHDSLQLPGTNGRPFNFVFRYRSQMDLELLGCNPRDTEPVPPTLSSQQAAHELTTQTIKKSAESTSKIRDGEDLTNREANNDLTATENFGVTQGMGNVAAEQPQNESPGNSNTIKRNDMPMEVHHDIKAEESQGHVEVRINARTHPLQSARSQVLINFQTKILDLEKQNSQLVQANQRLTTENAALTQTKEKMAALIQNLMSDMTNASAIPPAAVLTSTLPMKPAAPSNRPIPMTPTNIKRERIKGDVNEESSDGSARNRNRPWKRTKTVNLTAD